MSAKAPLVAAYSLVLHPHVHESPLYYRSLVVLYTQIHAKAMVGNDDAFTPDESWHRKLRYTIGKEYAGGYGDDDDDGATFRQARGMAFDHHRGLLLVVDRNNDRVQAFASVDGSFVCKFGSRGDQERQFRAPVAVAIDKDRSLDVDRIIVVDAGNERLQLWPLNEQPFSSYVSKRFTGLNFSSLGAVAIDKRRRRIIIVDRGRNRLVALSLLDFSLVFTIGDSRCRRPGEFLSPSGVAVDRDRDRIIAVDSFNHRIQVFAALDGAFLFEFGDEGNEPGQFNCPFGVCIDHQGRIIVSDTYNHRLQAFSPEGHHVSSFACGVDGPRPLEVAFDKYRGLIAFTEGLQVHVIEANQWLPGTFVWRVDRHHYGPESMKQAVERMAMIRSLVHESALSMLPNELLFEIAAHL